MIELTCIERIRCNDYDKNSKITGYRLQNKDNGKITCMSPNMLKEAIKENMITITNLKITSDNKLILTEEIKEYNIDKNMIRRINSRNSLSFKTIQKQEIKNTLLKAKIIGLNIVEIDKDAYALINNTHQTICVLSYKRFQILDGKEIFSETFFKTIDLKNVDTSKCTDATRMFQKCLAEYIDISKMDTSNIYSMKGMFRECINLKKIDISNFDTRKVTDMEFMFQNCTKAEIILGDKFKTPGVRSMKCMFMGCHFDKFDLSKLDLHNVISLSNMFNNASIDEIILDDTNIRHVEVADAMFYNFETKGNLDIYKLDFSKIDSIKNIVSGCKAKCINFSGVNLSKFEIPSLFSRIVTDKLILNNVDTSKISDMDCLFFNSEIGEVDLSDLDTSNVVTMQAMFEQCKINNLIGLNKLTADKVRDTTEMFYESEIYTIDLSNFNTTNIEFAKGMFTGCTAKHIDLSNFDLTHLLEEHKDKEDIEHTAIIEGISTKEMNKIIKFPKQQDLKVKLLKCIRMVRG